MSEIASKAGACPIQGLDVPKPDPIPAGAAPQLTCYQVGPRSAPIIPGRRDRAWMDQTNDHRARAGRRSGCAARAGFNKLLHDNDPATVAKKWQRGCFQGNAPDGNAPFHVNKRRLKPVE